MKWKRYRFRTRSVDDPRPLKFNPAYPFWISGYGNDHAIVVAYLPVAENLLDYWDDAHDVDFTEHEDITFSSRFPRPDYFEEQ